VPVAVAVVAAYMVSVVPDTPTSVGERIACVIVVAWSYVALHTEPEATVVVVLQAVPVEIVHENCPPPHVVRAPPVVVHTVLLAASPESVIDVPDTGPDEMRFVVSTALNCEVQPPLVKVSKKGVVVLGTIAQ
jgi:hypothetical protein